MKNIKFYLVTAVSLLFLCGVIHSAETYNQLSVAGPLPKQFDGMTKTNVLPGILPAAIYAVSNNSASFACVGTVYFEDETNCTAVLPDHLFRKGNDYSYAVRIAEPGNQSFLGFIDRVLEPNKENSGCDIVFAPIGQKANIIKGFSDFREMRAVNEFTVTSTPTVCDKKVSSLRSVITGKEVKILGFVLHPNQDARHPFVAINFKSGSGYSGSPFIDNFGRMFVLSAGYYGDTLRDLEVYFQTNGVKLEGIALLSGAVTMAPQ